MQPGRLREMGCLTESPSLPDLVGGTCFLSPFVVLHLTVSGRKTNENTGREMHVAFFPP